MRFLLLHFVGIFSVTLAVSFGPAFNQDAIPQYPPPFNSYGVLPAEIVQQPVFPQSYSFSVNQDQKVSSVFPQKLGDYQATGDIDNNLYPVQPSAETVHQQPALPQDDSFNLPQDEKTSSVLPRKYRAYLAEAVIDTTDSSDNGKGHFPDIVRNFATNFVQKIQASPAYTDAFSLHKVSRGDAAKLFKDYIYIANERNDDRDPEISSYAVSQAVNKNYESTTNLRLMEVHAYSAGELLYQTGQLSAENAVRLSDEYFRDTADAIDAVKGGSPVDKMRAAMTAFRNFLTDYYVYRDLAFAVSSVFAQVYYILN